MGLLEQAEKAANEAATWPKWMRQAAGAPSIPWERIAAYAVRNALSEHPSDDPTEKLADALAVLRQWGVENGANYYDAQARSRKKWKSG